ncbi:MAG: branched-chain amino acid ABC transporter permease, partial [candidate division NC10 bacterium]|nr:branched-chain amino acid ABC transporter permease [candidate division NC10 bacterium]
AGGLYALVALGLSLIFGVMRVINIAHGALLMLGAYTTYWLFAWFGMNPFLSLLVSVPILFVIGGVLQKLFVHRVVDAPELSSLLLTFGISIFLANMAMVAWTADYRSVEFLTGSFLLGPIAVSKPRLITFCTALTITGLAFLFLTKTKTGKAIRATSQHRDVAQVCGINVRRIDVITFGLGAGLAGAGGSLVSVMFAVYPEMGQGYVFKSFLVIVLGGAGNYPGALLGGMLLGLVEQLASLFLTTQLSEAVAYVLLVLVLLLRPTGLLGGRAT